jgi:hypothetical protein
VHDSFSMEAGGLQHSSPSSPHARCEMKEKKNQLVYESSL